MLIWNSVSAFVRDVPSIYCETQAASKIADLQGLLKAHSELSVLKSEHSAVTTRGTVICMVCTENVACVVDGRQLTSTFLASKGGCKRDKRLVLNWERHLVSDMHALCLQSAADKAANPLQTSLRMQLARRDAVLEQLFRTVAFVDKEKMSHRAYERLLLYGYLSAIDVGDSDHSRKTCRAMSVHLYEHGKSQVRTFAKTPGVVTARLPHFGTSIDKQSDHGKKQSQMQMVRMNYSGSPLTILWAIKMLTLDYDAENEANGFSCFCKLVEGIEDLGFPLFEVLEKDAHGDTTKFGNAILVRAPLLRPRDLSYFDKQEISGLFKETTTVRRLPLDELFETLGLYPTKVEIDDMYRVADADHDGEINEDELFAMVRSFNPIGHSEQFRSTATDGEACYSGSGPTLSVRARLKGDHGLSDQTHSHIHDLAHCDDLLIQDAHKAELHILDVIHPLLKAVYSHFSKSPHKYRHMMALVEKWGAEDLFRKLHYLFEVRFVASEHIAISNFLASYVAIVEALKAELEAASKRVLGCWNSWNSVIIGGSRQLLSPRLSIA
jgi:hypothetical protein